MTQYSDKNKVLLNMASTIMIEYIYRGKGFYNVCLYARLFVKLT